MVDLIPTAFSLLFVQRFIVSSCLFAKARVQHSLLYIVISIDPQLMQSCLSSFIGFCGSYLISNIHRSLSYTIRYSYKNPVLSFYSDFKTKFGMRHRFQINCFILRTKQCPPLEQYEYTISRLINFHL